MGAFSILMAVLALAGAVWQYFAARALVDPTLPPQFQEDPTSSEANVMSRFALDIYVWERAVPAKARRQYLRYLGLLAVFALFAAAAFYSRGDVVPALLFVALSAVCAVQTLTRWKKYRALL